MAKDWEKHALYILFTLFIFLQVFFLLSSNSDYGFGGADNIAHYQIAKYSFRYPELFLDLWGKPVYTTLLAPFTLFGYNTAKAFNILIAVFTLLLTVKIAKRLYPGSSLISFILLAFSPVYFQLSASCLTEPLFGLVLVLAVLCFIHKRFLLSAAIISFIPFVRSEGMILLPVFAVALVLSKSYRSLLFLSLGTLFYTIVGYIVFDDILWLINKLPYSMDESVYGSGSLFHFVKHSHSIFGIPLLLILISGTIFWVFDILKKFSIRDENTILFILIVGSWLGYFAAHSYVWWKGTGGSLGLTRVIGGVVPLAVLTGLKSFEDLSVWAKNKKNVVGIFSFLALLQIITLFTQNKLLYKADATEQLIKKSIDYIRFNKEGKKVYYFNPLVIHSLNIDPYDTKQCNWGVADKIQPSNTMDWGDILVWDAHFGPNEGGVQLENLKNDPYLNAVKSFFPLEKITVLGGYDYSVHLFEKNRDKTNLAKPTSHLERLVTFDETGDNVSEIDGEKFFRLTEGIEFGPGITIMAYEVEQKEILEFNIALEYRSASSLEKDEVLLIFSVENESKNLRYEKMELTVSNDAWTMLNFNTKIPAGLTESTAIKVYVWNKDRKNIDIKKLSVNVNSY